MRVTLLYNATSGYGAARDIAAEFTACLQSDGHSAEARVAGPGLPDPPAEGLRDSDLVVLVGGDGTVHHALPAVVEAGVPIYQAPTGTENLFARDWGMDRRYSVLRAALKRFEIIACDVGHCDGRLFALMCSVGFDASIIHRRAAGKRSADGHLAYVAPLLRELAAPTFPVLSIQAGGERVVEAQQGVAIVANSRQYAARLDPARFARTDDGLLDVVFLPCSSRVEALSLSAFASLGEHLTEPGVVYRRSATIVVDTPDAPALWQIDGEPLSCTDGRVAPSASSGTARQFGVRPAALRVLSALNLTESPS